MKRYVNRNVNPKNNRVGDCTVRAISLAMDKDWDTVYIGIAICGLKKADIPTSNDVWGAYLRENGFRRFVVEDRCDSCYTVEDFCEDHPHGVYVLALQSHVVAVIDGLYYDTWDSGNEEPIYYWTRYDEEVDDEP